MTVASILENVSQCLRRTHEKRTHFPSLYDIRQYELPGPSGAYARAKQLVRWCEDYDHLVDKVRACKERCTDTFKSEVAAVNSAIISNVINIPSFATHFALHSIYTPSRW